MNKFEHVRVLGRGAFGAANLVKRRNDGKLFAIKTIGARNELAGMTDKEKKTAIKEADVLRDLQFLHIVKYFDAWFEGANQFCIQMEYCEDGSVADVLQSRNGRHIKDTLILEWMIQLGMALKYLHDRNIVHRDVKPENMLLSRKRRLLKLGDFGIVSLLQNTNALTMAITGTPSYMAPEIHKGKGYNYPADIFAAGCVLYELVNLKKPFQVQNNLPLAICMKVVSGQHENFERDFCRDFILKCLNAEPKARPDINDLVETLTEIKLDLALDQDREQTVGPTSNRGNEQQNARQNENTLDRKERELREREEQFRKEQERVNEEFEKQRKENDLKLREMKLDEQKRQFEKEKEKQRREIEQQKAELKRNQKSQEEQKISVSNLFLHKNKGRPRTYPQILWISNNELILIGDNVGDVVLVTLSGDGHSTKKLPDSDETRCATRLSDGNFAIGQDNGSVSVWSRDERKQQKKIHKRKVTKICCLPDGGYFTTSHDETVATLDRNLNIVSRTKAPHLTFGFASSAETVATGHEDGTVLVYDTSSKLSPKTLVGHSHTVNSLSFQDKLLASGSDDWTVRLWNPSESDKPALTMKHDNDVYGKSLVNSVKFGVNPTKNNLFSCGITTRMWNVATGQQIAKFDHPDVARHLDIDKTGCIVATGHDYGVSLLDPRASKTVKEIPNCSGEDNDTYDIKFSPDGVKCAFTQYSGLVRMIDLRY